MPKNKPQRKSALPEKTCAACGQPFFWKKKWEKNWDEVKFCSDGCRNARPGKR